jgi:hypothetical protein
MGNNPHKRRNTMHYCKPQITYTAKAHNLIQGVDKNSVITDDSDDTLPRCTQAAYEADE